MNFTSYFPTKKIKSFLSLKQTLQGVKTCYIVEMDQNLTNDVLSKTATNRECNQCDYAYSQAERLKRHTNKHSVEISNKCNQCDYATSQVSDLRRHLIIHSGEKSNKCSQCDFASSRADSFLTHLKTHI